MNSPAPLTGSHLRTYQTICQRPTSRHLAWRAVRALLEKLAHLAEEPNGNVKVTRNGQSMVLHPPRTKDVADPDELMAVRHFLERSETSPDAKTKEARWLVVIDHREARVYRSAEPGSLPQLFRPQVPQNFFRHAPNSKDSSRGQEKPDSGSFFEPVAGVLNGAGQILIFGDGIGTSSELDEFTIWLQQHRPELAQRVVGSVVVDEHRLTEAQLLAQAREFYADDRGLDMKSSSAARDQSLVRRRS